MSLIILGLIVFLFSFFLSRFHSETKESINLRPWAWAGKILAFVLIICGVLLSSIVIVPAGHRGVLLKFGAVRGRFGEGIHLITPYVNSVIMMEVRTQKEASEASAASKDLQVVTTTLALNFHVDPLKVEKLYQKVGTEYISRIIDPAVQESIKMVTAKFTAEELIKSRAKVKSEVEEDITKRLKVYNVLVEPLGLSITNFDFSKEFNAAIEAKQVAQQDAERQRYLLQKAELEKQTKITQAQGISAAAKLNAAALQVQGGSKVLAREWIEKWDGHVPAVASGTEGGGIIIDINSLLKNEQ